MIEQFGQIYFWEKNLIDLDADNIVLTTDGDYPTDPSGPTASTEMLPFLRNRNNIGIWSSTKAGAVKIEIFLNGLTSFDSIMLVDNNFETFTIDYVEAGTGLVKNIATVTGNTKVAPVFNFPQVEGTKVIISNITQQFQPGITPPTLFGSKRLGQVIITRKIFNGSLFGYPKIKNQEIDRSKKFNRMISGKYKKVDAAGAFSAKLNLAAVNDKTQVLALQRIFNLQEGVLIHMNLESQNDFWNNTEGYRPFDYYLVSPKNNFDPSPYKDQYDFISVVMDLVEVV